MRNAMVMMWNRPVPGREGHAVELFETSLTYFGRLLKENKIDGFKPVILGAHAGPVQGMLLIEGDGKKLGEIRASKEFLQLVIRGNHLLDGFGVTGAYVDDSLVQMMDVYRHVT